SWAALKSRGQPYHIAMGRCASQQSRCPMSELGQQRPQSASPHQVPLLVSNPTDVSLHVFRRHQTNLVTKLRQITCPIMRRGTRLHATRQGGSDAKNFNT